MYKGQCVTAVIFARSGSTRLEDKMLLPFGGETVVETVISRTRMADLPDEIVLATSDAPPDDRIAALGRKHSVRVVRGCEQDVLSRFVLAVETTPESGIVLRICADNPFIMPGLIDAAVRQLVDEGADAITSFGHSTCIFGSGCVGMTRHTLSELNALATAPTYREHVENYLLERTGTFNVRYQAFDRQGDFHEQTLTLDHLADYEKLRDLAERTMGLTPDAQLNFFCGRADRAGKALVHRLPVAHITPPGTWQYCLSELRAYARDVPASAVTFTSETDLWEHFSSQSFEAALSSVPVPSKACESVRLGVAVTEPGADGRYILRYQQPHGGGFTLPCEPIYREFNPSSGHENADEFTARIAHTWLIRLACGPLLPFERQETLSLPAEKRGNSACVGFTDKREEFYPTTVLLDAVDADGQPMKPHTRERLVRELASGGVQAIAPAKGSTTDNAGTSALLSELAMRTPCSVLERPRQIDDSPFAALCMDADGTMYPATRPGTPIGNIAAISLTYAWRSGVMRRERQRFLNGRACR